jgi:glutamate racemase
LLLDRVQRLAPWPVEWLDPAPAIARRIDDLLGPAGDHTPPAASRAFFTSGKPPAAVLQRFGIESDG